MEVGFKYYFHPVGQGLFASGCILGGSSRSCLFRWVFDCGTSSSSKLVEKQISVLEQMCDYRRRLDLVTISHFDKDHISGVCELISKFTIGTLVLPYMPLWQRLMIGFEQLSGPTDALTGFFINPSAYLTNQPNAQIKRILYVMPGGAEGAAEVRDDIPTEPSGDEPNLELIFDRTKPESYEEYEALRSPKNETETAFLQPGASIRVGALWEFVPYNDDPEEEIPEPFRLQVASERDKLLNATATKRQRNSALHRLKKAYDKQFGDDSVSRNEISLFLYGGPIYESWKEFRLHHHSNYFPFLEPRPLSSVLRGRIRLRSTSPFCSILYSGDAYLDTPEKLNRMIQLFQQKRIERLGVFQVMHHGADGNWHKGVAAKVNPVYSIFSSDPDHKGLGHPHGTVLRDFWGYGPVQVDKNNGFACSGSLVI